VLAGASLISVTSITVWVELIGNANLLDWSGDSLFRGLTRFLAIEGGLVVEKLGERKGDADDFWCARNRI
jgi:hypothetical protein